jgi:hypothetical protein
MASMPRALIICDCDEVILHMVVPFKQWLDAEHDIDFDLTVPGFLSALKKRPCGTVLMVEEIWPLLDGFFAAEMHRQYPAPGALAALQRISLHADIAILTNIGMEHQDARTAQLRGHGLNFPVTGSKGHKGEPAAKIAAHYNPSLVLFIDDLPQHHRSVADHLPSAWRLHMVCEPALAPIIPAASAAHARIDDWASAESWIMDRISDALPAPKLAA